MISQIQIKDSEHAFGECFDVRLDLSMDAKQLMDLARQRLARTHCLFNEDEAFMTWEPRGCGMWVQITPTQSGAELVFHSAWGWEDSFDALDGTKEPPKVLTLDDTLQIAQLVKTLIN